MKFPLAVLDLMQAFSEQSSWQIYSRNKTVINPDFSCTFFVFLKLQPDALKRDSALNSTFNSFQFAFKVSDCISAVLEQKDIMHCLAFPSALLGAPFHIDNRTVIFG